MAHPIIWLELSAKDRKSTAQWYADLFGWNVRNNDEMNYSMFDSGEGAPSGGFAGVNDQYPAGVVTFYIQTDDVAAHLKRIEAKGGQTVMPPTDIPTVGTIAMFRDPTGNIIGLLHPQM